MPAPISNAGALLGFIAVDPTNQTPASVSPEGALLVGNPASQIFNDTFGNAAFDVNKWNVLNGGTGVAPTAPGTNGSTTLSGGTTANSYSLLLTKPTFQPTEPGVLVATHRVNLQSPVPTPALNYIAWGLMNVAGVNGFAGGPPTFASPIVDGAVFDIVNGQLFAATYGAGVRLPILALGTVKDVNAHKYNVRFRPDACVWTINDDNTNIEIVVASYKTGASGPVNNQLSAGMIVVANTGATAATIIDNGSTVSDTAHTTVIICDAVYGFRKAFVSSGSHNVALAANYTPISTAGTTTIAQGGGIFFGLNVVSTGTAWTATPYDIVVAGTTTNQLAATGTAAAVGGLDIPGISGLGVRFQGTLAIVTTGTAGLFNALWD